MPEPEHLNPKEQAKLARVQAREQQELEKQLVLSKIASDLDVDVFGFLQSNAKFPSPRSFTDIANLRQGSKVWLRGRINEVRGKGSICFLVLRQQLETIQAIVDVKNEHASKDMVKWASSLTLESIVDVYGTVVKPNVEVASTSSKVELHVERIFCVSKAAATLPFLLKDANNTDCEAIAAKPETIKVNQDTRLDARYLDLRTTSSICVFRIQQEIVLLFCEFLYANDFSEIHTPKLLGGASEGGCNVFKFKYFDKDACLAQSPQLYKQLAICGDMKRVFEIGHVFRAENSNTHRHLCEFVGLDLEMEFYDSYLEVVDLVDKLLKSIFHGINSRCKKQLEILASLNPSIEPFRWLPETPRLKFSEAVELLRPYHPDIPENISDYDFTTEHEKHLGKLIKDKFGTDYYIVYGYPANVRPFYTSPGEWDDVNKFQTSDSYDFFMRGEEILSGAHRIHEPELLLSRAIECNIDPKTITSYLEAFKYGVAPHAGCGIGLERVTMLFLGLGNIRKTCMFPRDPKRLEP